MFLTGKSFKYFPGKINRPCNEAGIKTGIGKIDNHLNTYKEFWQNNLQSIEIITKKIEKDLFMLEKRYADFDTIYDNISGNIDVLSAIYSSYNNLNGKKYLLKLRAALNSYKKNYKEGSIDFDVIYNLYSKIYNLLQSSFSEFPSFEHKKLVTLKIDVEENDYHSIIKNAKFKWLTFKRSGSWFITRFNKFQNFAYEDVELKNKNIIKIKNKSFKVIDLFSSFSAKEEEIPKYYLLVKFDTVKCFAAAKLGRKIYGRLDQFTPNLIPFKKSRISPGRVRVFGKNHIYL